MIDLVIMLCNLVVHSRMYPTLVIYETRKYTTLLQESVAPSATTTMEWHLKRIFFLHGWTGTSFAIAGQPPIATSQGLVLLFDKAQFLNVKLQCFFLIPNGDANECDFHFMRCKVASKLRITTYCLMRYHFQPNN